MYVCECLRSIECDLAAGCLFKKIPSGIHKVSLKIFRSQANGPAGLDYRLEGLEVLRSSSNPS